MNGVSAQLSNGALFTLLSLVPVCHLHEVFPDHFAGNHLSSFDLLWYCFLILVLCHLIHFCSLSSAHHDTLCPRGDSVLLKLCNTKSVGYEFSGPP